MVTARVPLTATTDLAHGGRWTSLRTPGREWLWHRPEPRRATAAPGEAFADAGGLEECVPTVRGTPDHGHAWTRPWRPGRPGEASVTCPGFELTRRLTHRDGSVVADYRLTAEPGYRFLWAAHALLGVSGDGRVEAPAGTPVRLFPEAAPHLERPWPPGAPWIEGAWPAPHGFRLDTLAPDDGTAVGAVLLGTRARVSDGGDALLLAVEAEGQPVAIALWRNLRGYPAGRPYRSVGVEPMLGRVFDLAEAGEGDAATVPASGEVRWRLTLTATTTLASGGRRGT
jgi:hypothetical protein